MGKDRRWRLHFVFWGLLLGMLALAPVMRNAIEGLQDFFGEQGWLHDNVPKILEGILLICGMQLFLYFILKGRVFINGLKIEDLQHHDITIKSKDVSIDLKRVSKVEWTLRSISLQVDNLKVIVSIPYRKLEDTKFIIKFFRQRFPEEMQFGWKEFWESNWKIFDRIELSNPISIDKKRAAFRRRIDVFFVIIGLIAFFSGCILWQISGEWGCFVGMGVLLLWPIRFSSTRFREIQRPIATRIADQMPPEPKELGWISAFAVLLVCVAYMSFGFCGPLDIFKGATVFAKVTTIIILIVAAVIVWLYVRHDINPNRLWNRELNARAAEEAEMLFLSPDLDE